MFGNIDAPQLLIISAIIIMIFGVGKLPQAAGSLGKAMKEFRKETQRTDNENDDVEEVAPKKKRATITRKPRTIKTPEKAGIVENPVETTTTALHHSVIEEKVKSA